MRVGGQPGQCEPCLHVDAVSNDRAQVPKARADWLEALATARLPPNPRRSSHLTRRFHCDCRPLPHSLEPSTGPLALTPLRFLAGWLSARDAIKLGGPPADRSPSSLSRLRGRRLELAAFDTDAADVAHRRSLPLRWRTDRTSPPEGRVRCEQTTTPATTPRTTTTGHQPSNPALLEGGPTTTGRTAPPTLDIKIPPGRVSLLITI